MSNLSRRLTVAAAVAALTVGCSPNPTPTSSTAAPATSGTSAPSATASQRPDELVPLTDIPVQVQPGFDTKGQNMKGLPGDWGMVQGGSPVQVNGVVFIPVRKMAGANQTALLAVHPDGSTGEPWNPVTRADRVAPGGSTVVYPDPEGVLYVDFTDTEARATVFKVAADGTVTKGTQAVTPAARGAGLGDQAHVGAYAGGNVVARGTDAGACLKRQPLTWEPVKVTSMPMSAAADCRWVADGTTYWKDGAKVTVRTDPNASDAVLMPAGVLSWAHKNAPYTVAFTPFAAAATPPTPVEYRVVQGAGRDPWLTSDGKTLLVEGAVRVTVATGVIELMPTVPGTSPKAIAPGQPADDDPAMIYTVAGPVPASNTAPVAGRYKAPLLVANRQAWVLVEPIGGQAWASRNYALNVARIPVQ